jgi:hypothetical protein
VAGQRFLPAHRDSSTLEERIFGKETVCLSDLLYVTVSPVILISRASTSALIISGVFTLQ